MSKQGIVDGTVDHTFSSLIHTIGQSIAAATLMVSIGKALTQYYFCLMMTLIIMIIGTLSYIDILRRRPQINRGYIQNYIYTAYERITEKEVDTAIYNIMDQQAKLLTNATPKNQAVRRFHKHGESSHSLMSLESPKLGRKQKRL